ncbi:hypothetical protein ACUUMB_15105 [Enterobacter kobei]
MIAIDKLRAWLEKRLNMTAISEPNNALSRRSLRIAQTGMSMSPLPGNALTTDFTPFELILTLQITLKLSGGNSGDWLTGQIAEAGIGMHCFLQDDVVLIRDVTEDLPAVAGDDQSDFLRTRIVGDGELTEVRRVMSNYENAAQNDKQSSAMHFYTELWTAKYVLTLHRLFTNPRLRCVRYQPDGGGDPLLVGNCDSNMTKENADGNNHGQ